MSDLLYLLVPWHNVLGNGFEVEITSFMPTTLISVTTMAIGASLVQIWVDTSTNRMMSPMIFRIIIWLTFHCHHCFLFCFLLLSLLPEWFWLLDWVYIRCHASRLGMCTRTWWLMQSFNIIIHTHLIWHCIIMVRYYFTCFMKIILALCIDFSWQ